MMIFNVHFKVYEKKIEYQVNKDYFAEKNHSFLFFGSVFKMTGLGSDTKKRIRT